MRQKSPVKEGFMFVSEIKNRNISVSFEAGRENLQVGSFLKISSSYGMGVVTQVLEVVASKDDPTSNIAVSKIIFSHDALNRLVSWNGNIPSKADVVESFPVDMLLSSVGKVQNPVFVGKSFGNADVYLEKALFAKPVLMLCDRQEDRVALTQSLNLEMGQSGMPAVILDFRGEYEDFDDAVTLEAGKNFKLCLDPKGIDSLYNSLSENLSAESAAVIEDIFINLQDYAEACDGGFIPFSAFKDVIDAEYEENKRPEMAILKNKLVRLEKQGIYANTEYEIQALKYCLENNNHIVIDLSGVSSKWYKEFAEFVIDSNITRFKQPFFLFMEAVEACFDYDFINKLYTKGYKSGIRPVISTGYQSKAAKALYGASKNFVLPKPASFGGLFPKLEPLMDVMEEADTLITGDVTYSVPLIVKQGQPSEVLAPDFEEPTVAQQIDDLPVVEYKETEEDITEYSEDYEGEYEEEYQEEAEDLFAEEENYESVPVEEPQVAYQPVEEEADNLFDGELPREDVEGFYDYYQAAPEGQEEQEYEEYNVDFSDEDLNFDEITEEITQNYKEEPVVSEPVSAAYDDIDSLYTVRKEPQLSAEIPVYPAPESAGQEFDFNEGDTVKHEKYGLGVIKKIIGYGNKKLCSIQFDKVGRRLLDPQLAVIEKVS